MRNLMVISGNTLSNVLSKFDRNSIANHLIFPKCYE